MKYVVKLGGATLEDPALLRTCAKAIAALVRDGHQVAVVHGGGVQLTRVLKQLGKVSEFIGGLRVTDAETRDAALMVLGGRVNKSLVAALGAQGIAAMGMSGGDGMVFRARKKRTAPDLGFVGEIAASDPRYLEAIWQMGGVPVISSLALGFDGEYYNVNADEMAAACATTCRVDALVFLTDVPGVRGADGTVMRWLSTGEIAALTRDASVITGGMLPKLNACRDALAQGVKRVRILPAGSAALLPDLCSTRVNRRHRGYGRLSGKSPFQARRRMNSCPHGSPRRTNRSLTHREIRRYSNDVGANSSSGSKAAASHLRAQPDPDDWWRRRAPDRRAWHALP